MNTVTFHPWPVRAALCDNPDELRIDLDPQPGRSFADVVRWRSACAKSGRHRTDGVRQDLGQQGVHVYCRIAPTRSSSMCAMASSGSRESSSAGCPPS